MNNNSTPVRGVYIAAAIAVMACFAAYLLSRALNIPYQDDILDVLNFTLRFEEAQTWKQSLAILLEQHNDHRTSASRLAFYGLYQLFGEVNFRSISLVANLAVPLFCALYSLTVPRRELKWLALLLAALLLCQPQAYGLLFWSMSAFAFYNVLLYGFVSFYCLHRGGVGSLALAGLAAGAATFSLASGQLIWLVGMFSLCWQCLRWDGRPWFHLVAWLAMGALALALYYSGVPPRYSEEGVLASALQTPLHHLAWYMVSLGSALGFSAVPLALASGALLLGLAACLLVSGIFKEFGPLHAYLLFLLGAALLVTLGRAPYSGLDYALAPRYSVASQHVLLTCLLLLLSQLRWPRGSMASSVIVLATLLCAGKYWFYTPILDEHLAWRVAEFSKGKHRVIGYPLRETNAMVVKAVKTGKYLPPQIPVSDQ